MLGMSRGSFLSTMCRCRSGENKKYEVYEEKIERIYDVYDTIDEVAYRGTANEIAKEMGIGVDDFLKLKRASKRKDSKRYVFVEDEESEWMDK